MRDLDSLKAKVMAPSLKQALKAKRSAHEYAERKSLGQNLSEPVAQTRRLHDDAKTDTAHSEQARGDRAGIKVGDVRLRVRAAPRTEHDNV